MKYTAYYYVMSMALLMSFFSFSVAQAAPDNKQVDTSSRTYHGWLSDRTEPTMWAWQAGTDTSNRIFDRANDRQYTARWVHVYLGSRDTLYQPNGNANFDKIKLLAQRIHEEWVAIGSPPNYALFIQNFGKQSGLFLNNSDKLSDAQTTLSEPYIWSKENTVHNATLWRENGLHTAQIVLKALILEMNNGDSNDTPAPTRFFLDEEYRYWPGCNSPDPIAVYSQISNDGRANAIVSGSFDQITTGLFTANNILEDLNWVPERVNENRQLCSTRSDTKKINRLYQVIRSNQDGIIADMIDYAKAETGLWSNTLWSNFDTSLWYTPDYPYAGSGGYASVRGISSGWLYSTLQGSSDIHSPSLYRVHPNHQRDKAIVGLNETADETRIRIHRKTIDHAIFSLDTMKPLHSDEILQVPAHIVPWIARSGTLYRNNNIPVTENQTRDLMAMLKSKGINEIIMWGNQNHESEHDWNANNNITSQVWDYNLDYLKSKVRFYDREPTTTLHHNDDTIKLAQFAEESTLNIKSWDRSNALLRFASERPGDKKGRDGRAVEFVFQIKIDNNNLGSNYSLIIEALTGGGAWDGIFTNTNHFAIKIANFDTNRFESLNSLPNSEITELYSTSARRVEHINNRLQVSYDDSDVTDSVIERKDITKWSFDLAKPCNYINPSRHMLFLVRLWHNDEDFMEDYQLDSIMLYETTPFVEDTIDQSDCSNAR